MAKIISFDEYQKKAVQKKRLVKIHKAKILSVIVGLSIFIGGVSLFSTYNLITNNNLKVSNIKIAMNSF